MLEELKQIYNGKKIFVTGHTGFKGSWLIKVLSILGAETMGYALKPENEDDLYNIIKGDTLCTSVIGDLRNRDLLIDRINQFQPDFVFHLAAQPLVRLSYEIPSETFEVNAIGTANVLDGVRLIRKPCHVVLITTDKVYYNYEWVYPYRESDRLGGYDPYSASKACAELIIDSYRNSFFNLNSLSEHGKAIAVARAGNVIGGGDWSKDRLLPDIARALGSQAAIIIRNPNSIRPWQHVLEPVIGYLLLGRKLEEAPRSFAQAYNFGPHRSDALMVKDMAAIAIEEWGWGEYKVVSNADQPHEAGLLSLDISKAECEIGWKPGLNAREAIAMTIGWYKTFFEKRDFITKVTEDQIMSFFMKISGRK